VKHSGAQGACVTLELPSTCSVCCFDDSLDLAKGLENTWEDMRPKAVGNASCFESRLRNLGFTVSDESCILKAVSS
jgi:hypothetical protein